MNILNLGIKVLKFESYYLSQGYYESFVEKMNKKNYITVKDRSVPDSMDDIFCVSRDFLDSIYKK